MLDTEKAMHAALQVEASKQLDEVSLWDKRFDHLPFSKLKHVVPQMREEG